MVSSRWIRGTWMCALVGAALTVLTPAAALANVTHVVAPGHTIRSIAARYRVSPSAVLAANKGKDPRKLRPGDTLIIPKTMAKKPAKPKPEKGKKPPVVKPGVKPVKPAPGHPDRPKH